MAASDASRQAPGPQSVLKRERRRTLAYTSCATASESSQWHTRSALLRGDDASGVASGKTSEESKSRPRADRKEGRRRSVGMVRLNVARSNGGACACAHRPPCPAFSLICVRTMYLLRRGKSGDVSHGAKMGRVTASGRPQGLTMPGAGSLHVRTQGAEARETDVHACTQQQSAPGQGQGREGPDRSGRVP